MVRRIGSGCAVVCALLAWTSVAIAKEEPFGTPGQVVITNGFAFSAERYIPDDGGLTNSSISLTPAADLFVLPGLSVGGHLGYARSWLTVSPYEVTTDELMWGLNLGYAWSPLERLSLWPSVGVSFNVSWSGGNTMLGTQNQRSTGVSYGGSLPLLFHVAPHFFLGFGPIVTRYAASWGDTTQRTTRIAANTFIGGWF